MFKRLTAVSFNRLTCSSLSLDNALCRCFQRDGGFKQQREEELHLQFDQRLASIALSSPHSVVRPSGQNVHHK